MAAAILLVLLLLVLAKVSLFLKKTRICRNIVVEFRSVCTQLPSMSFEKEAFEVFWCRRETDFKGDFERLPFLPSKS